MARILTAGAMDPETRRTWEAGRIRHLKRVAADLATPVEVRESARRRIDRLRGTSPDR